MGCRITVHKLEIKTLEATLKTLQQTNQNIPYLFELPI